MALKEKLTDELMEQFAEEFRRLREMTFDQYVAEQMRLRELEHTKLEKLKNGWGN